MLGTEEDPTLGRRAGISRFVFFALGLILISLVYAPVLFGESCVSFGDIGIFTLPQLEVMEASMRSRELPEWNDAVGLGQPYLGDASMPALYPPLLLLLTVLSPLKALNVSLPLHLAITFFGIGALARALKLSVPGAMFAAVCGSLGGCFISLNVTPMYLWGAAWLPWAIAFFLWGLDDARGLWPQGLSAVAFALIAYSGALEVCALAGVAALGLALPGRSPWRILVHLGGIAVLALGLAAPILWPFAEALPHSKRALGLSWTEASEWSLHPLELTGLALPQAFDQGSPFFEALNTGVHRPWFLSLYLGAPACVLAVFAVLALFEDRRVRGPVLLSLILLPFAFGAFLPFYGWAFELIPFLRGSRYPAKLFMPVALALALLAGIGLDRLTQAQGEGDRRFVTVGVVGVVSLFGLSACAAGWLMARPALSIRALFPLVIGGLCLAALRISDRRRLAWALVALLMIDLGVSAHRTLDFAPARLYQESSPFLKPLLDYQRSRGTPTTIATLPRAGRIRIDRRGLELSENVLNGLTKRDVLVANVPGPYGLRNALPFSPLSSVRQELLRRRMTQEGVSVLEQYRRLGTDLIIFVEEDDAAATSGLKTVMNFGPLRLGQIPQAAAYARLYSRSERVADREAAIKRYGSRGFDLAKSVILEGAGSALSGPSTGLRVSLVSRRRDELVFAVRAPVPAVLVVLENWSPGWEAKVDGATASLVAANALYRGVELPAGARRVVLRYRGPGVREGRLVFAISASLGILILVIEFLIRRARRVRGHGGEMEGPRS